jgi:predicted ATPase/class 3 adenylate cyclase
MNEVEQLEQAISALEAQRTVLGDAVVNAALAPMREKLAALQTHIAPAGQQRKQVTVLFADIIGFTAMSERLDAEDVSTIINSLWARLDRIILSHGGTIDKHIGDEVMALWGSQHAREDDPEQGVRAALALQAELHTLSNEAPGATLAAGGPSPTPRMRIGINTGPVLLGAVGTTGEFTAIGDTVNVASRLQHAAPIGGVLISHDTYRQVRGLFDVQPQAPLSVRGKAEPVQTYVVERARPSTFGTATRGVEGVETRMVGREMELVRLQDAFNAAIQEGVTRVVTVCGEPGVGKSRLLAEFLRWLESSHGRIAYFKGRATPQTVNTPYMLLHDLLATQLNILESDPATLAREKLEHGLAESLGDEGQMKAHFIGALAGYDFADSPHLFAVRGDPRQLRSRALFYLVQFLANVAQHAPSVILLEDIHWADAPSLDAIRQVARELPLARLLIVCLTRPALYDNHPNWGDDLPIHTRLDLVPLSREDSRELVDAILRKVDAVPDTLRELIVTQAEGNPFYVEELIKVLIDDHVIVQDGTSDVWRIEPTRLSTLRVPPTLTAVLQARLDSLSPNERKTLQRAAVVGRTFWDAVLQVLQGTPEPPLPVLDHLCHRELISPHQPAAFAGVGEYLFKHALLRDVTYESVLKRERQTYHARVADWLVAETQAHGRAEEYAVVISEHYELAGETDRAVRYVQQAAEHALAVSAYSEAQTLLEHGLDLLDAAHNAPSHQHMLLHRLLGDAFQKRGDFAPAQAHYEQSLALARQFDDSLTTAGASLGLSEIALGQGDTAAARQRCLDALREGANDPRMRARALHGLGLVTEYEGDSAGAADYYQQSLEIHREIGNRLGIAQSLNSLCVVAFNREDYGTATDYCQQSLAIKRELGDRAGIAVGLNNLGDIAHRQGNYAAARDYFLQSLDIDRDIGNRRGVSISLGNLVEVYLDLGQPQNARDAVLEGLRLTREIEAIPLMLYLVGQAARWRLVTGQPLQAAEWAGLMTYHPLTEHVDREQITHFRSSLEAAARPDDVATAWVRGQALELDRVVDQILAAK